MRSYTSLQGALRQSPLSLGNLVQVLLRRPCQSEKVRLRPKLCPQVQGAKPLPTWSSSKRADLFPEAAMAAVAVSRGEGKPRA
jgi:hypothetical protein